MSKSNRWEPINYIKYTTKDSFSGSSEEMEGYCIGNAEVYMENDGTKWEGLQTFDSYVSAIAYQSGCWETYIEWHLNK